MVRIGIPQIAMTLGLGLCLCKIAFSQSDSERVWRSKDGNDSVVASLRGFDKDTKIVSLRTENDELIDVKIHLLSTEDRRFIARANRRKSKPLKVASDVQGEPRSKQKASTPKVANDQRRYGIDWTPGVDLAFSKAKRQQRPVMLFRVLGDLNGLM